MRSLPHVQPRSERSPDRSEAALATRRAGISLRAGMAHRSFVEPERGALRGSSFVPSPPFALRQRPGHGVEQDPVVEWLPEEVHRPGLECPMAGPLVFVCGDEHDGNVRPMAANAPISRPLIPTMRRHVENRTGRSPLPRLAARYFSAEANVSTSRLVDRIRRCKALLTDLSTSTIVTAGPVCPTADPPCPLRGASTNDGHARRLHSSPGFDRLRRPACRSKSTDRTRCPG